MFIINDKHDFFESLLLISLYHSLSYVYLMFISVFILCLLLKYLFIINNNKLSKVTKDILPQSEPQLEAVGCDRAILQ